MVAEQWLNVTERCVSRMLRCGCCRASVDVSHTADTAETVTSGPRQSQGRQPREAPREVQQETDVEKLTDEDVGEMILETDVDGDF